MRRSSALKGTVEAKPSSGSVASPVGEAVTGTRELASGASLASDAVSVGVAGVSSEGLGSDVVLGMDAPEGRVISFELL